jgi:protein-S-isoprenylcysteine O-methyltransferase Ste14
MAALLAAAIAWRGHWITGVSGPPGVALAIAGAWLGIAGVRALGVNRTPFPEPKPGSQLVTTGIYGRLRHPLYASMIALGFAWALLWRSVPALGLALAQVVFLHAKARTEERLLTVRFPDYQKYARRVPRFFPRFKR